MPAAMSETSIVLLTIMVWPAALQTDIGCPKSFGLRSPWWSNGWIFEPAVGNRARALDDPRQRDTGGAQKRGT